MVFQVTWSSIPLFSRKERWFGPIVRISTSPPHTFPTRSYSEPPTIPILVLDVRLFRLTDNLESRPFLRVGALAANAKLLLLTLGNGTMKLGTTGYKIGRGDERVCL